MRAIVRQMPALTGLRLVDHVDAADALAFEPIRIAHSRLTAATITTLWVHAGTRADPNRPGLGRPNAARGWFALRAARFAFEALWAPRRMRRPARRPAHPRRALKPPTASSAAPGKSVAGRYGRAGDPAARGVSGSASLVGSCSSVMRLCPL